MEEQITVVGAVIVRDGRILAARRGDGMSMSGLWEFPGGKVEDGESPTEALVREIHEELGCGIRVGDQLTRTEHVHDFGTVDLTTYWCELLDGEPRPTEHAELRWVGRDEMGRLRWAPADVPAVEMILGLSEGITLW